VKETVQGTLARHLVESIDRLHKQIETVEFWANAMNGFVQPVPDYEPEATALDRYIKPGRPPRKRRRRKTKSMKASRAASSATPASA
jgi:hypothetical protein